VLSFSIKLPRFSYSSFDMANLQELYRPWLINGTYFNRMLLCGRRANGWLEVALMRCLPVEMLDEWKERLAFLSTVNSDAFRIGTKTRLERELIFISEHIIPPKDVAEDHPDVRYFIFVALHEIAHVIRQHRPPNEIYAEDNQAQEDEADALAFAWFNSYIKRANHPHLKEFTTQERDDAAQRNKVKLEALQ
jgi:hypothetical protein